MDPSPLKFDKADFGDDAKTSLTCGFCNLSIDGEYYEVNGQTACADCRDQYARLGNGGTPVGRFARAVMLGGIGGVVGAGVYYAVLALTGYEIGLVAIAVGFLVGIGVRVGSGGLGGRAYQVLAVAITYLAIVSTYIPFIIEEIRNMPEEQLEATESTSGEAPTPGVSPVEEEGATLAESESFPEDDVEAGLAQMLLALIFLVVLAMASPFLAGIQNIIGLAIIGFALYEAWRLNVRQSFSIEGPFRLARSPEGAE